MERKRDLLLEDVNAAVPYENKGISGDELMNILTGVLTPGLELMPNPESDGALLQIGRGIASGAGVILKRTGQAFGALVSIFNPFAWGRMVERVGGFLQGIGNNNNQEAVDRMKTTVKNEVRRELADMHSSVNEIKYGEGQKETYYEMYFNGHLTAWNAFVKRVEAQKQNELEEEIRRIQEQLNATDRGAIAVKIKAAEASITRWNALTEECNRLIRLLETLRRTII